MIAFSIEEDKEPCSLEYGRWSDENGLFPWHITTLKDAIHRNRIDLFHNNRGQNKWQIVFIGPSFEACSNEMDRLIRQLEQRKDAQ